MGRDVFRSLARRALPWAAALALVASACNLLPAGVGGPSFVAATLASPDAWAFTSLTLRPSVQQALYAKDIFDFYANGPAGGTFGELPTPSGRSVDFETDVLPLLDGEIAYAASGSLDQPLGVLLIHTSDATAMLRLLADERTPAFTKDGRGAMRYTGSLYMAAGYKSWVVYSNDAPTLEQTLDRIDGKGGPSLATLPRYKAVVDRLTSDHMAYGYVDLTPLVQSSGFGDAMTLDPSSARGRLAYSMAFAGGPEPGLRALDTRFEFIPDTAPPPSSALAGDSLLAMDRLPVGNAAALAGPSIGRVVESLQKAAPDDIPDDVLTFLHAFAGPYAFGVSPAPGSRISSGSGIAASVFFLGQLAPDADVDALQDQAAALVDEAASESDSGTYQHQVVFDGSWMAINVVPASIGLDAIPQDELASDRIYQWMRPGLTQDGSNLFINLRALQAFGADQGASSEDLALFNPLRALGATYRMDNDGSGHGRMQIMVSLTN